MLGLLEAIYSLVDLTEFRFIKLEIQKNVTNNLKQNKNISHKLVNNIYDFVLFKDGQAGQNHDHEALLPSVITFNLYYGILD